MKFNIFYLIHFLIIQINCDDKTKTLINHKNDNSVKLLIKRGINQIDNDIYHQSQYNNLPYGYHNHYLFNKYFKNPYNIKANTILAGTPYIIGPGWASVTSFNLNYLKRPHIYTDQYSTQLQLSNNLLNSYNPLIIQKPLKIYPNIQQNPTIPISQNHFIPLNYPYHETSTIPLPLNSLSFGFSTQTPPTITAQIPSSINTQNSWYPMLSHGSSVPNVQIPPLTLLPPYENIPDQYRLTNIQSQLYSVNYHQKNAPQNLLQAKSNKDNNKSETEISSSDNRNNYYGASSYDVPLDGNKGYHY